MLHDYSLLQILYVRFGKTAHITFCVVALMTNLVITTSLLLAGKTALEVRNHFVLYRILFLLFFFGTNFALCFSFLHLFNSFHFLFIFVFLRSVFPFFLWLLFPLVLGYKVGVSCAVYK